MQLTVWTYEGPPHVGAMRIATAMKGLHYVLHAPQGDTYADLLFTMIERRNARPPVTYTTFQARDLGGDTADLFKTAAREAFERFQPEAMIVGASCTAELIQDDPGGLARALALPVPVVALDLPSYQKKENWGASETFYQLVRNFASAPRSTQLHPEEDRAAIRLEGSRATSPGRTTSFVTPPSAAPQDEEFNAIETPSKISKLHPEEDREAIRHEGWQRETTSFVTPPSAAPQDEEFNAIETPSKISKLHPEEDREAIRREGWQRETTSFVTPPSAAPQDEEFCAIETPSKISKLHPEEDREAIRREGWRATNSGRTTSFVTPPPAAPQDEAVARTCNILGPTALGFRHRDDVAEIERLLSRLGIRVNVVAPLGASPSDLARLPDAGFNVVLYPEIAETAARWLEKTHGQKYTRIVPIGHNATVEFVREVAMLAGVDPTPALDGASRLPWWSRSVDSNYLTGKRVFIFGDATHALAAARVAREELGFEVVGLGTYSREYARDVRAAAEKLGLTAVVTDDYLDVEKAIADSSPELVLGTQMERHIAKRLGIGCAVISAPAHVQDYPARYSPVMGFEGANVIFDSWVHPLTMGLEEHLLAMFREDFEFHDDAGPSHLSAHQPVAAPLPAPAASSDGVAWSKEAEAELTKIPFFVRGKARRNAERYAAERGLALIRIETLYDAKSHFAR